MLLSTWVERSKLSASGALQARTHTNKQTHRCWFPSGTGPHGVGYHLCPQSPLQGKHQWLSLIPHSRSVLKGPWTDGEMGETLHISGHGQQPQVPSHHTRTIPLNMEHKDKGDGIGASAGGGGGTALHPFEEQS